MKLLLKLIILFFIFSGCAQKRRPLKGETKFQKELNAFFKDVTTSPLKNEDREKFDGLDFFPFDSVYVVKAKLIRTPNEPIFKMKTTTNRTPLYKKYGKVTFTLKKDTFSLNIYQSKDIMAKNKLFLPFLDETNGTETYGGGRYIDTDLPSGDVLTLNFNEAYNPYCAYNKKYSCPIVPSINYLKTRVEAGVKVFKKN